MMERLPKAEIEEWLAATDPNRKLQERVEAYEAERAAKAKSKLEVV